MLSNYLTLIVLISSLAIVFLVSRFVKSLPKRVTIYLILIFLVYCFKASELIISPKRFHSPYSPEEFGMEYRDINFSTEDGINIRGWYIEGTEKGTIILCHPYGMDKGDCLPQARFLNRSGYNILLFDFRGHGNSGGKYSSLGYYEVRDLLAGVSFLKEKGENRIGVMGFSMGGTVALLGASLTPDISAVVSEGAYLSFHSAIYSFAKCYYRAPRYPFLPPAIWTAGIRLGFNPKELNLKNCLHKISPTPILVIHSRKDREIPISEGIEIFNTADEPKYLWVVSNAEHLECYMKEGKRYEKRIIDFFATSLRTISPFTIP
ncbi:MAG: alpha/beta fold hydrolase [candidate division WOR-3 bacterium]|nr:alpha/beta fold hydrolase [candidate division WOR-3 bacterium]